ncbi:hypothetical protein [Pseudomonas oryzihabitans]|uniref:hypothetical protein n=1 Tax=Pseudomonas oryzihabitans TaxID=47885 RepID=UPI0015E3B830|nr:hypothetical protein [Pseudomonas psychrotolerans]MBA1257638.1 hypothetical protein [Pseudomonas psychrotolerans]
MNRLELSKTISSCIAAPNTWPWDAISAISTALTGFFTFIALITAVKGLNTWKKQSLALEKHQLAKRLIQNTYKRKMAISAIRNPFSQHDLSKYLSPDIDPKRKLWLASIDEIKNRFSKLEEQKSAAQPDLVEADLLIPESVTQKFKDLEALEHILAESLHDHIEATRPLPSDDFPDDHYDEDYIKSLNENGKNRQRRRIIYGTGGDSDEFNKKIESAYFECIDELKKYLIHSPKRATKNQNGTTSTT